MTNQQRELRRLGFILMVKLMKLHGCVVWILKRNQWMTAPDGVDVDAFYDRYSAVTDAVSAFRRCALWRSVDVDEDFDDEV